MGGLCSCVKGKKSEEDRIEQMESSIRDLVVMLRRSESREEEYKLIIRQHGLCGVRELPRGRRRKLLDCGPEGVRLSVLKERAGE